MHSNKMNYVLLLNRVTLCQISFSLLTNLVTTKRRKIPFSEPFDGFREPCGFSYSEEDCLTLRLFSTFLCNRGMTLDVEI